MQGCCRPGGTFWIAHHELSPSILGVEQGGRLGCRLILFTLQWALQHPLSAVFQGNSRSALLTICWMVNCDYSPCRQKKEREITNPVVSDLHSLSISWAELVSVWGPLQQLYVILFHINQSNTAETTHRQWFSRFILFSASPSFICWIMLHNLTLIFPLTFITQKARDTIYLSHYIILWNVCISRFP